MVTTRACWMFGGLVAAVVACKSSDKPADPPAPAPAAKPAPTEAPAAPAATDDKNPCEQLRPMLLEVDREALENDAWTKAKPEAKKQIALTEGVEAALAVCTSDHWSAMTIRCILDSKDGTAQDRCGLSADEDRRADAATAAVYNRIFGPHP
jgi:hypothetical protein